MEGMDWLIIVSGVLGVVAIIAGVKWVQAKKVIKEFAEAIAYLSAAIEDDNITREECKNIVKEFGDVITAVVDLVGKK